MTVNDFIRLTRHFWRWILLAAVIGVTAGAGYSAMQPVLYRASASGYVTAAQSGTLASADQAMSLANAKASQYVALVNSRNVQDAVRAATAQQFPAGVDQRALTAASDKESSIVTFTAVSTRPEQAAALANAAVKATAAEARRLETLQPDGTSTGESAVTLVPSETAATPRAPFSPNWPINLLTGLAAGLVLGYSGVLLRKASDVRVRTQRDVEEATGAGTLGIIPKTKSLADERGANSLEGQSIAAEAMRSLRTNLAFVSVDNPPRAIVVTSASPGEGKSTIIANVARVLAEAGEHVVLIDADLRRPTQAKRFGVDNSVGLAQVLSGRVDLADGLQPTQFDNLQLLGSGRIPPNPSELVGSNRMRDLLSSLVDAGYFVLVDAPPILAVTDAGLLTRVTDGCLLVIKAGKTNKEEVREVVRRLGKVQGRILGSVLNQTPERGLGAATYGYGYKASSDYYSAYTSGSSTSAKPPKKRDWRSLFIER